MYTQESIFEFPSSSMASLLPALTTFFFLLFFTTTTTALSDGFPSGAEKKAHLHFFFQDIFSGPNHTVVTVASAPSTATSPTKFGSVFVVDDPLTAGPDMGSDLIGRAQGMYTLTSQEEFSFLMVFSLEFVSGRFNGSTLTMVGRNPILSGVREMPIVGGTGKFRMARGYAVVKTHSFNSTTSDATVEYDVFVLHYDR